jgi:hypothetical protein
MTQFNTPGQVTCPHCGQGFAVQPQQWQQYQGRSINCTSCGKPFVVGAGAPMMPAGGMPPPMSQGYPPGPAQAYYPPPKQGMSAGAIVAIVLVVGLVVLVPLLISILLPALNHVREEAQKAKCSANLTQIMTAIVTYANQNNGEYPDSFATMIKSTGYPPGILVCPSSNDTPSTNANIKTDADLVGNCSYVYLGKGLTVSTVRPDTILAYEPLSNHHRKGINVLYGDMSVRWLSRAEAEQVIPGIKP